MEAHKDWIIGICLVILIINLFVLMNFKDESN